MERFLIESPHEAEDCDAIIKEIHAAGYLHHFEWGCHDGHTADGPSSKQITGNTQSKSSHGGLEIKHGS